MFPYETVGELINEIFINSWKPENQRLKKQKVGQVTTSFAILNTTPLQQNVKAV